MRYVTAPLFLVAMGEFVDKGGTSKILHFDVILLVKWTLTGDMCPTATTYVGTTILRNINTFRSRLTKLTTTCHLPAEWSLAGPAEASPQVLSASTPSQLN